MLCLSAIYIWWSNIYNLLIVTKQAHHQMSQITHCLPAVRKYVFMYVCNKLHTRGLVYNYIGTHDIKLHSFEKSQVGRRECKALASSQTHSWVISDMAFRHHKATQISKNYESWTSQKPATKSGDKGWSSTNVELAQKKVVTTNSEKELGISKELRKLGTFQEPQKKEEPRKQRNRMEFNKTMSNPKK